MALRLSGIIEYGQLINDKKNSTHGWLQLKGSEQCIAVSLTGDMSPDLKGKRFAFWPNPDDPADPESLEAQLDPSTVHPQQVGPTGTMTAAKWVKTVDCSTMEFVRRAKAGEVPPHTWKRCLYLEWFSQNGRVLIELPDPLLEECVGEEEGKEIWAPMAPLTDKPKDTIEEQEEDKEFDAAMGAREAISFGHPYKAPRFDGSLFDDEDKSTEFPDLLDDSTSDRDENPAENLNSYFDSLSAATDKAAGIDGDDETDADFIRELEYMDDIIEGKHDDDAPLNSILSIGDLDKMTDEEAEIQLKEVLGILALHSFAIHICKHYSAKATLRLIRDDYGVESRIHPGLLGSGWVTNFDTAESCPTCDAEWEEEHKDWLANLEKNSAENNIEFDPGSGDLPF